MHAAVRISLWAFLTALTALGWGSPGRAQPPHSKTAKPFPFYGDGFVLLQHGNVLHGFVKPHADRITIALDKGNEVTIPNRQVLTVGKSMETLYAFQVRAIGKWGTGEHWHLAQWCIQNGLLDQAIEHYTELEKTASGSPKFKQLDLQLRQALLADAEVQKALAEQGIENPIVPASYQEMSRGLADSTAREDDQVDDRRPPRAPPFVPGYLRRGFQTDVLPIVVSRCGQSGCHGMLAKNEFQIFQPVGEQASSISQKNLEALMAYVDHADPAQTSLIQYATRPHGSQRNPSLHPNREEDRALTEKILKWLKSLAEMESEASVSEPTQVTPAVALVPRIAAQAPPRRRVSKDWPPPDRSAKLSKPAKSAPPPIVLDASELQRIEDAISQLEQKHQETRTARDPLDPAVFNEKFANEKSTANSK